MSYKISVVISAYNRKEYLLEAIKSAVNQSVDRSFYEIVVVKNFTDSVIDEYIETNNIVHRLIGDTTVGESIVLSLEAASGEYVSFLDDDDIIVKNKIELLTKLLDSYKNIAYIHNGVRVLSTGNMSSNPAELNSSNKLSVVDTGVSVVSLKKFFNSGGDFNLSSITANRKLLLQSRDLISKIKTHTDTSVFVSLFGFGQKMISTPEVLTYYRVNEIGKVISKNIQANLETFEQLLMFSSSKNLFKILKSQKSEFILRNSLRDHDFARLTALSASFTLLLSSVFPFKRYRIYMSFLGVLYVFSRPLSRLLNINRNRFRSYK